MKSPSVGEVIPSARCLCISLEARPLFVGVVDMLFASRSRTVTPSPRRVQPVDSTFDGPLGSYLDGVVRFEDRLSRLLAPLARWTGVLATLPPDRTAR